jgi:hypothetical protein
MREQADHGRDVDRIYRDFHGAAQRFGESKISAQTMSNGRRIFYPASWDGPERRTRLEEREQRLREIERLL